MAKAKKTQTFTGYTSIWRVCDFTRKYGVVTVPFEVAQEFIVPVPYSALSGKGEQRGIVESHKKKLKKEMANGTFTPCAISAGLRKKQIPNLSIDDDGVFTLVVDTDDPLPLTDGGHRTEGMTELLKEFTQKAKDMTDADEKAKFTRWAQQIKECCVTIIIYFDGNTQSDFLNLQAGRTPDAAHMLSLKMQSDDNPSMKMAFDTARILHQTDGAFKNQIRFDSRGSLPLPISTLCSKGSSDIGTSLIGLARIALHKGGVKQDTLAGYCNLVYGMLEAKGKELLEYGKLLTPMGKEGTKGSSTMLIGISTCLAYRVLIAEKSVEESLELLVKVAKTTLDNNVKGNLSGPAKREYLGGFARKYFSDLKVEMHDGLPKDLLTILSCSTFSAIALPKAAKASKAAAQTPAPTPETPVVPEQSKPVTPEPEVSTGKPGKKSGKGAAKENVTTVATVSEQTVSPVQTPASGSRAKKPTANAAKAAAAAPQPKPAAVEEEKMPWEVEILG